MYSWLPVNLKYGNDKVTLYSFVSQTSSRIFAIINIYLTRTRAAAVIETSVADRAFISLINHQTAARSATATPYPSHHQLSGDANGRDDVRTATLSNRFVPACSFQIVDGITTLSDIIFFFFQCTKSNIVTCTQRVKQFTWTYSLLTLLSY
jgi:hypothetical protein